MRVVIPELPWTIGDRDQLIADVETCAAQSLPDLEPEHERHSVILALIALIKNPTPAE